MLRTQLFLSTLDLWKNHEVAWAPWAGGPLRVHSHISMGTISSIISFSGIFFPLSLILLPIRVWRECNHSLTVLQFKFHLSIRTFPLAAGAQGFWGRLAELHNSGGAVTSWHMWKWHSLELLSAQPVQLEVWSCGIAFLLHLLLGLLSALSPPLCECVSVFICVGSKWSSGLPKITQQNLCADLSLWHVFAWHSDKRWHS